MGAFAVPIAIASTVLSAGLGVNQALNEKAEGKAQEADLERQAEQEKIAAVDREGQRRRRLNQILGTTIAETGARGIKFEGSPEAVAKAEIGQAGLAEQGAKISDLSRISQLKRAGKTARIRGSNQATTTLLTTAAQAGASTANILQARPSKKKVT